MKIVEIEGNHYEVGVQLGQESRKALHEMVFNLSRFKFLKDQWQDTPRFRAMMASVQSAFPSYFDEMRGIADGAGVPAEDIFLWNCRGDFPDQPKDPVEAAGCTDVLMAGDPDAGIPAILAHNEDADKSIGQHCFLAKLRFNHVAAPVTIESFLYPGIIMGNAFSMNSHGLVLTINHLPWHREEPSGIPRHFICRAILDCETIEEALSVIRQNGSTGGFNYNLGQAGRKELFSVEAPSGSCKAVRVSQRFVHTNHCIQKEHQRISENARGSTVHRQHTAERKISSAAPDVSGALDILFDATDKDFPILRNGSVMDNGISTIATVVYQIGKKEVSYDVFTSGNREPVYSGPEMR